VRTLYYTKGGKKDAESGDIDESTSFVSILSNCADFKKDFPILEKIAEPYNSMIWFTPKYHCKLAGEGVEYVWGYYKPLFCRVPLASKRRKKADFEDAVRNTVSLEMVPPSLIRHFSRRARQYICVYHHLHSNTADADTIQVSLKMVEKLVKNFKMKRNALDFEHNLIEAEAQKTFKRIKLTPQEKVAAKFMKLNYASVSLGKRKRKENSSSFMTFFVMLVILKLFIPIYF